MQQAVLFLLVSGVFTFFPVYLAILLWCIAVEGHVHCVLAYCFCVTFNMLHFEIYKQMDDFNQGMFYCTDAVLLLYFLVFF
jgi:hypothetical protein